MFASVAVCAVAVAAPDAGNCRPPIVAPFLLYSSLCTVVLLFWPGANSRYAMPIAPALAVLAGIGWDGLEKSKYVLLQRVGIGVVTICLAWQLVLVTLVMPNFSSRFGASRLAGGAIGAAIAANPAPAYCTGLDTNQLFYVRTPISCINPSEMKALSLPAWLVTPHSSLDGFVSMRPDVKVGDMLQTRSGPELVAARLEPR